ncbi:MAG: LysM peptidoglycan-binding domain-containing protein, partial [Thermoguttaceae bacterium]
APPAAAPLRSGPMVFSQNIAPAPQADASMAWRPSPQPSTPPPASPVGQIQQTPDVSAQIQGGYAGAAAQTTIPLSQAATSPAGQDDYPPYTLPATLKPQANFTGLSANATSADGANAEGWAPPSTTTPLSESYSAQPNDNFYTISKRVYGSGAYFRALAEYNKDKYPQATQIRIGDPIQTPPPQTLESRYPELCPKAEHRDAARLRTAAAAARSLVGRRVYEVQEGDNLFDIARFELGSPSRVADLIELNRDVLGNHINYLTPGMRLLLPETDPRGPAVTQAPTATLR